LKIEGSFINLWFDRFTVDIFSVRKN